MIQYILTLTPSQRMALMSALMEHVPLGEHVLHPCGLIRGNQGEASAEMERALVGQVVVLSEEFIDCSSAPPVVTTIYDLLKILTDASPIRSDA